MQFPEANLPNSRRLNHKAPIARSIAVSHMHSSGNTSQLSFGAHFGGNSPACCLLHACFALTLVSICLIPPGLRYMRLSAYHLHGAAKFLCLSRTLVSAAAPNPLPTADWQTEIAMASVFIVILDTDEFAIIITNSRYLMTHS